MRGKEQSSDLLAQLQTSLITVIHSFLSVICIKLHTTYSVSNVLFTITEAPNAVDLVTFIIEEKMQEEDGLTTGDRE